MMPMPVVTSDAELVELANSLAAEFHYIAHAIRTPPGYRYDLAVHPWERSCWRQAVVALAMCRGMDVAEATMGLQVEHQSLAG